MSDHQQKLQVSRKYLLWETGSGAFSCCPFTTITNDALKLLTGEKTKDIGANQLKALFVRNSTPLTETLPADPLGLFLPQRGFKE